MTDNNALVSGLMGEQFRLEMMVPQRAKEPPKTSDGIPVSLPFSIQVKQENTKNRSSRVGRVELKNMVIHQRHIPGQHWGAGRSPSNIEGEGKTVDTEREEYERIRKEKVVFPTGGGESTNSEKTEALY